MPKLYKSIKVEQGLKIGLREPSGSEWFADMTIDRDRRTCRKIKLGFDPTDKQLYIDPGECIDCGACEPECPVEAIFEEDAVPEEWSSFIKINYDWFGRDFDG